MVNGARTSRSRSGPHPARAASSRNIPIRPIPRPLPQAMASMAPRRQWPPQGGPRLSGRKRPRAGASCDARPGGESVLNPQPPVATVHPWPCATRKRGISPELRPRPVIHDVPQAVCPQPASHSLRPRASHAAAAARPSPALRQRPKGRSSPWRDRSPAHRRGRRQHLRDESRSRHPRTLGWH